VSNRVTVDFSDFDGLVGLLEAMGGPALAEATQEALLAAWAIITPRAEAAIRPRHRSGRTEGSLRGVPWVMWDSRTEAHIDVGFAVSGGGLASVFLTLGTRAHPVNHPGSRAFEEFHDAFWGQDEAIAEAWRRALEKVAFR